MANRNGQSQSDKIIFNSIEGGNKKMYVKVKNSYGDTIVGYSVLLLFSGDGDGN